MLDSYLESLACEQKEKTAAQATFGPASVEELAKIAGIKLAENVCSECGSTMEKSGSMYKCSCGMMKKARALPRSLIRNAVKVQKAQTKSPGAEVPVGLKKKSSAILEKLSSDQLQEYAVKVLDANGGDMAKTAAILELQGMSKEAIGGVLGAIGKGARGMFNAASRGVGRATGASTQTLGQAAQRAGAGVRDAAKQYGGQVAQTFRTARGLGRGGMGPQTATGVGGFRALGQTMAAHPELAAGAAGAGGAALGLGAGRMSKSGSAKALLEVGDAAGRILAKTAAFDMDELRESVEEAKAREDIPGRARRWQIGGGIGGGLGGAGAGAGLGGLIGGRKGALLGGALGAIPGAAAGQYYGKRHGAEEAAADKAISMLRALRARNIGMQSGIQAGARAGYMAGLRRGSMAGGETKTSSRLQEAVKTAFSVTEEGHKFDADLARARAEHGAKAWALAQRHGGVGSAVDRGSFWKALRGFTPFGAPDPRHEEYVAQQHEKGENAWNPFGGLLTPSSKEVGGTTWQYGKFKQPEEEG